MSKPAILNRSASPSLPEGQAHLQTRRQGKRRGFTLVEILIVVVILGILAAIVVPKLSNASQTARENTLRDDLRFLRTQITVYASQHGDVFPGFPAGNTSSTPTAADFLAQMTSFTDLGGNPSATGSSTFAFGPYLSRMPDNPLNAKSTVKIITGSDALTPDDSTGWLYQPATGKILPNLVGSDATNVLFSSY